MPLLCVILQIAVSPLCAANRSINLAGTWRFATDSQGIGIEEEWFNRHHRDTICLPGITDNAGVGEPEQDPNPGYLSRMHKYIGPAWYQREIEIPLEWQGDAVELFLERVMWESRTWIDGTPCGVQDSLGTPHIHALGKLTPGKHILTVQIDNRMIHPIGDRGHCYTEFTQIKWNGAVGKIELRAYDPVRLGLVRLFPDRNTSEVTVETTLENATHGPWAGTLTISVKDSSGIPVARSEMPVEITEDFLVIKPKATLKGEPREWDEFSPTLYTLELRLRGKNTDHHRSIEFGFRTIRNEGNRFLVNGRPTFMRGNLDCAQYPLTGHPPVTVKAWKRVFRVHQDYGMNHVRFHSWCPPEAAFLAADEMGMYLLPEVLWIDGWMGIPNNKEMDTPGHPKGVGKGDRTIDQYAKAEMRRMLDTYGNHPSFCLFAIGNELGSSNFEVMGEWVKEEKDRDPRRLYAASAARTITAHDDFSDTHNIPGIGTVVNRMGVPHTDWDYQSAYGRAPVPIIAHEMGQMPVYPDWKEIPKYVGPVRARNFEQFRAQAKKNGIEPQSADFQQASGAMNRILYKNEMEAQLRSPGCAGVSWLSLQDFPGQGEALVGWLDTFYDSKGLVTPEAFRRYSAPTVPLTRFKKFVWSNRETFTATAQLSHWGREKLSDINIEWTIYEKESHRELARGQFSSSLIPVGTVHTLGDIAFDLHEIQKPTVLKLEMRIPGTSMMNDWDLWVFPITHDEYEPTNVLVTDDPVVTWKAFQEGNRVLFTAHTFGSMKKAAWMPLFWSSRFFPGQNRDTLGALVWADHPAFSLFPTDSHLDWQWYDICRDARGFVLNEFPEDYRPIVQPVSDYHYNNKLGSLFEFRNEQAGRLLVCGYNIVDNLETNHAAHQLKKSLLVYASGNKFHPDTEISREAFERFFPNRDAAPVARAPAGFENAVLYVQAGGHHPGQGNVKWNHTLDKRFIQEGFGYGVQCDAVWKDDTGVAWWGSPSLEIEIRCSKPNLYDFYVHFHDWNNNARSGEIVFEGRKYGLGPHTGKGKWIRLDVLREDALDEKLVLEARHATGPNLMISAIALIPKE